MSVKEATQQTVETHKRWLEQAIAARLLVDKLPDEIKDLDGSADVDCGGVLSINLWGGKETAMVCAKYGAVIGKLKAVPYSGAFGAEGTIEVNGVTAMLTISGFDTPPNCELVKVPYEAYKYEAKYVNEEVDNGFQP